MFGSTFKSDIGRKDKLLLKSKKRLEIAKTGHNTTKA